MDRRDFLMAVPAVLAASSPAYASAESRADVVANVLVRGQSNALLFCDRGGIWKMASQLESAGLHIAILAEWGTNTSTIHSGTRFMDWPKNGQQASLLAFLTKQAAEVRARKTITLWIHNENEQNSGVSKGDWVKEVRADAGLVRKTLGQTATTTPYMFCPIKYNFGKNLSFLDGMKELIADTGFNATLSEAFLGASMSGDGQPNSSHLGDEDMAPVAVALAPAVIALLRKLVS
ncbi:MAG: hypothetical protein EOP13_24670 [Pseudomonas sp.]|uniref:hypothetical protein n=1 Tax=Pseudomonas sp. TaxID=306 RepID=UPI00121503F7|nr:hypothetical protein [Pseudomonas sp.]RZI68535.1 MAG: hypothetical protein EOP13_24670 [Pseudomonas sp.]